MYSHELSASFSYAYSKKSTMEAIEDYYKNDNCVSREE